MRFDGYPTEEIDSQQKKRMKGIEDLLLLHHPQRLCASSCQVSDKESRREKDFSNVVILDGGLATAMEQKGADLNRKLWSAHYIRVNPDLIQRVHQEYFEAGADVVITASYQASVEGFQEEFDSVTEKDALDLMLESVRIASRARQESIIKNHNQGRPLLVAASIGPYGACLPGGEEYHGDYGRELGPTFLEDWHRPRFETLVDEEQKKRKNNLAIADVLAMETIPCLDEVRALLSLLRTRPSARAWISVTCKNETQLRSGELIADFITEVEKHDNNAQQRQVQAIGVNCTPRQFIPSILNVMKRHTSRPIIIYPNNGDLYDATKREWIPSNEILNKDQFATMAQQWRDVFDDDRPLIVGGCCTTDQTFIQALSQRFRGNTNYANNE